MAKGRIVITASGKVSVFIDEGTFDQAKERIEKVLSEMGVELGDVEFVSVSPVEAHRHDHDHVSTNVQNGGK